LTNIFGSVIISCCRLFFQVKMNKQRSQLWNSVVFRLMNEYKTLSTTECQWIDRRLDRIDAVQRELDQLFCAAEGEGICHQCQGDCCAKGHNHMTLVNLLSFARHDVLPPDADFERTCPFLGSHGCDLSVASRPYNCITFICDSIESALNEENKERFYDLDRRLRNLYLEFSQRYQGGVMTGLLIQEQRRPGQPLLSLKNQ
jgi:hypothetical protein